MAKALLGTHVPPRTAMLIDEVRALRNRVAQLEAELAAAEAARAAQATELLELDLADRQTVSA